jgi:hypothetical protein
LSCDVLAGDGDFIGAGAGNSRGRSLDLLLPL